MVDLTVLQDLRCCLLTLVCSELYTKSMMHQHSADDDVVAVEVVVVIVGVVVVAVVAAAVSYQRWLSWHCEC